MPTTAGIDIGSEAIKAVVLSCAKRGPVEVLAAGSLPLGELGHMEDSPDKTLALGVKLKEVVKSARIKAETRRMGVSGSNTSIRYLQVPPVPNWRLDMLVKYEVEEKSGDKEPSCYDHRTLDIPDSGGQDTVLVGVLKEAAAAEMMGMAKAAGLGEVELDLEALALYNAYYHGHGYDADKTVLVADIGSDDLTILLVRNGALFMARTMMGGGRRFTSVIADELKLDLLEAEELKKSQAQIIFDALPTGRTVRMGRPGGMTGTRLPAGSTGLVLRPGSASADPAATAVLPVPGASQSAVVPALQPSDTPAQPSAAASTSTGTAQLQPGLASTLEPALAGSPGQAAALINTIAAAPDLGDDKRKRQMSSVLVREAAGLCAALENAVVFCRTQTKSRELKVDRIYVSGGGSKLKGLAEFMSRRMRLEVLPLEPLRQLSLSRLPAAQGEALKDEQHTLAIAIGLAVGNLQKGAFSFLFWPEELKQRKIFWARGAYLYYTAALAMLSAVLFLWTPYRNINELEANKQRAEEAIKTAREENAAIEKLRDTYRIKYQQLKQIRDNVLSGHFLLNMLAELKDPQRISDEIVLTEISTTLPDVLRKNGVVDGSETAARPGDKRRAPAAGEGEGEDSFLAQRRVFLRGFARSADKSRLFETVTRFAKRLTPNEQNPDDPRNLFKQVDILWANAADQAQDKFSVKEFVFVAYTEIPKDNPAVANVLGKKPPKNLPPKGIKPDAPTGPLQVK